MRKRGQSQKIGSAEKRGRRRSKKRKKSRRSKKNRDPGGMGTHPSGMGTMPLNPVPKTTRRCEGTREENTRLRPTKRAARKAPQRNKGAGQGPKQDPGGQSSPRGPSPRGQADNHDQRKNFRQKKRKKKKVMGREPIKARGYKRKYPAKKRKEKGRTPLRSSEAIAPITTGNQEVTCREKTRTRKDGSEVEPPPRTSN